MKKIAGIILLLLVCATAYAQTGTLKVTFKFLNIIEGYDHLTKSEVWIDGEKVGESPEVKESQGASFTVNVPLGKHDIKVVNYAYYEGTWEEHSVANDYSIDCTYEDSRNFKKSQKLFLIHDIDTKTWVGWKKAPKVKKP